MGNLFELLGDKTTKRKEKNPSLSLSYILELFLSLSLSLGLLGIFGYLCLHRSAVFSLSPPAASNL
jgi:hypothetical protein